MNDLIKVIFKTEYRFQVQILNNQAERLKCQIYNIKKFKDRVLNLSKQWKSCIYIEFPFLVLSFYTTLIEEGYVINVWNKIRKGNKEITLTSYIFQESKLKLGKTWKQQWICLYKCIYKER